jgi:F-type H+-transporting ATPase subunit b
VEFVTMLRFALTVLLGVAVVMATAPCSRAQGVPGKSEKPGAAGTKTSPAPKAAIGEEDLNPDTKSPVNLRTDLAIFTFIVFVLLLLLLWIFAWGPIARKLDEREQRIADNIAAAQRQNDEAKRILVEHQKILDGVQGEVRAILDEARRDAQHTQDEILAKAREEAQRERDRSLREIDLATQAALKELGEKSVDLAVQLAGKIVSSKLSPDDHERMVKDAVARFGKADPSRN